MLDYGLYLISRELAHEEHSLEYFKLPPFVNDWSHERDNPLILVTLDLRRCGVLFCFLFTFPYLLHIHVIPFFIGTLFPSLTNITTSLNPSYAPYAADRV